MVKLVLSSLEFIQEHKNAFLLGIIISVLFGLFLGETVISVMFHALQPILAGTTLVTVETMGAILVDFPLSVVAGIIIAKKIGTTESKYGVLTGAVFLTVFIVIVLCMGILHNFTTFFDVYGLGNAVILAVQTAWQQFGFHLGVMMFMFLIFDYFLCMLGGMLGFKIVQLNC